jgi:hypothetical protein
VTPTDQRRPVGQVPVRSFLALAIGALLAIFPGREAAADTMLAVGHTDREVAEYFAPAIYQDVADGLANDPLNRVQDLLTNADFDGDWNANNNVENTYAYPLRGFVYYDAVETGNYLFLIYSFFHPRDWNTFGGIDHENDQENIRLLVHKDAGEWGRLVGVDMNAHGFLYSYWVDGEGVAPGTRSRHGDLDFEDDEGNVAEAFSADYHHVRVFVESKGHGPYGCKGEDCDPGNDNDKVVYTVMPGGTPEDAVMPDLSHMGDEPVVFSPYVLASGLADYWSRRTLVQPGTLWDQAFTYEPVRNQDGDVSPLVLDPSGDTLLMGGEFQGDEGGGGGLPPWSFTGQETGIHPGDWLIDAAYVSALWYELPGEDDPAFWEYWSNPYLNDLLAEPLSDEDADGVPDVFDNCPDVANPGQEDVDGNGVGDACEPGDDDDDDDNDSGDDDDDNNDSGDDDDDNDDSGDDDDDDDSGDDDDDDDDDTGDDDDSGGGCG